MLCINLSGLTPFYPNCPLDGRNFGRNAEIVSGIKTILGAVALVVISGPPLQARGALADMFAQCAGRYSAEMEHAWLMGGSDAEVLGAQRGRFVTLLDATVAPTEAGTALSVRIEAKLAHASLLTLATFNTDTRRADVARATAHRHLQTCAGMLLEG